MIELKETDIINLIRKNGFSSLSLEHEAVSLLTKKGLRAACAESCTGGLVSERITRVSGASAVFDCGICSYSNEIKHKVLGVQESTLAVLGAVSAETAIQMAEGVLRLSGADIAVSTTGIAGPTGGTPEKPVGLVYVGVCAGGESKAVKLMLGGSKRMPNSREKIRGYASDAALFIIIEALHKM